jgi:GNAT superfamily N-acetyltransferase
MERCLRPERSGSLSVEFPLVFEERFGGRVVAYEEKGDVRSTCALLLRELIVGGARMRVGLLGSVATEIAWRGKGLAARVLDEAERVLAQEGCALAFLWADDPEFYAARGYQRVGWEVDCVLPTERLAALSGTGLIRELSRQDCADVQRIYEQHPARVERSPSETAALLNCPGMSCLVLLREHCVVAYACLGRGADFANTIHEWGGACEDVLALAAEHARRALCRGACSDLAMILPPGAKRLRERLAELGAGVHDGVLGMAKVIDMDALAGVFNRFGGDLRAQLSPVGGELLVRGPSGVRTLDERAALAVLLSQHGARDAVEALEQELGARAPKLPLAPFFWGLDSI